MNIEISMSGNGAPFFNFKCGARSYGVKLVKPRRARKKTSVYFRGPFLISEAPFGTSDDRFYVRRSWWGLPCVLLVIEARGPYGGPFEQ